MVACRFLSTVLLSYTLAFCLSLTLFPHSVDAQTIYSNNFDQHSSAKQYSEADLVQDWQDPVWNNGVEEGRVSIVSGQRAYGGSGSSLAISYPKGTRGSKACGAQWRLNLDGDHEELYLSYRVKFESGFDFVRGGKLPGLGGGTTPTGNDTADGENGWTARMMWKTGFKGNAGSPQQSQSNIICYAQYAQSGPNNDGKKEDSSYLMNSRWSRSQLKAGNWYQITQRIKLNEPGQANGVIQIWLDGKQVLNETTILFRTSNNLKIDIFYFSTFFGGGNDWATSKDETVYFDDFVISKTRVDRD